MSACETWACRERPARRHESGESCRTQPCSERSSAVPSSQPSGSDKNCSVLCFTFSVGVTAPKEFSEMSPSSEWPGTSRSGLGTPTNLLGAVRSRPKAHTRSGASLAFNCGSTCCCCGAQSPMCDCLLILSAVYFLLSAVYFLLSVFLLLLPYLFFLLPSSSFLLFPSSMIFVSLSITQHPLGPKTKQNNQLKKQ